jgi:hypothetical protein
MIFAYTVVRLRNTWSTIYVFLTAFQARGAEAASYEMFLRTTRDGVTWLHNFQRKAQCLDKESRREEGVAGAKDTT